jgi:hypothetical protein
MATTASASIVSKCAKLSLDESDVGQPQPLCGREQLSSVQEVREPTAPAQDFDVLEERYRVTSDLLPAYRDVAGGLFRSGKSSEPMFYRNAQEEVCVANSPGCSDPRYPWSDLPVHTPLAVDAATWYRDLPDWNELGIPSRPVFPSTCQRDVVLGFQQIPYDNRPHEEFRNVIPPYLHTKRDKCTNAGQWFRQIILDRYHPKKHHATYSGYWRTESGFACLDAPVCCARKQKVQKRIVREFLSLPIDVRLFVCGGDRILRDLLEQATVENYRADLHRYMNPYGVWRYSPTGMEGRLKRFYRLLAKIKVNDRFLLAKNEDLEISAQQVRLEQYNKETQAILDMLSSSAGMCKFNGVFGKMRGSVCQRPKSCYTCWCCERCCECTDADYPDFKSEYDQCFKKAAYEHGLALEQLCDAKISLHLPDVSSMVPDCLKNISGRDWRRFFIAAPLMIIGLWSSWGNWIACSVHLAAFAMMMDFPCTLAAQIMARLPPSQQIDAASVSEMFGPMGGVLAMLASFYAIGKLPSDKETMAHITKASKIGQLVMGGTAVYTLGDRLVRWIKDLVSEYVFGIPPVLRDGYRQISDWVRRVFAIDNTDFESRCRFNKEIKAEVDTLLTEGHQILSLVTSLRIPPAQLVDFHKAYMTLNHMRQLCSGSGAGHLGTRPVPAVIHLFGATGVGKSTVLWPLIADSLVHMGFTDPCAQEDNVYWRAVTGDGSDFWDAYHNAVAITVCDDIGTRKDSEQNPNPEFTEAIRMANTANFMLRMANLADKGNTFFRSSLVFWTSNVPDFDIKSVTNPEAVLRRIDLQYEVVPKPQYAVERTIAGKTVLTLQVEGLEEAIKEDPSRITSFVTFNRYDPLDENKVVPIRTGMSYEDVVQEIKARLDTKLSMHKTTSEAQKKYFQLKVEERKSANIASTVAQRYVEENRPSTSGVEKAKEQMFEFMFGSMEQHVRMWNEVQSVADQMNTSGPPPMPGFTVPMCWIFDKNIHPDHKNLVCQQYVNCMFSQQFKPWIKTCQSLGYKVVGCPRPDHQMKGPNAKDFYLELLGSKRAPKSGCYAYFEKYKETMKTGLGACLSLAGSGMLYMLGAKGLDVYKKYKTPKGEALQEPQPGSEAERYLATFNPVAEISYNVHTTAGRSVAPKVQSEAAIEALKKVHPEMSLMAIAQRYGIVSPDSEWPAELEEFPTLEGTCDQNALEVGAIGLRNLYLMERYEQGKWVPKLHVLFIMGTVALTNAHLCKALTNPKNLWRIRNRASPTGVATCFQFEESQLEKKAYFTEAERRKDVMLIEFPRQIVNAHRNILGHFLTREDHRRMKTINHMRLYTWSRDLSVVEKKETVEAKFADECVANQDGVVIARNAIRYTMQTQDGDCGGFLTIIDKTKNRKLVGIHAAAYTADRFNAVGMPVTLEDLKELVTELKPNVGSCMSLAAPVANEQAFVQMSDTAVSENHPLEPSFVVLGKAEHYVHSNVRTNIKPSPVMKLIGEPKTKPAHLRPIRINGEMVDPMERARNKVLTGPNPIFDRKILRAATHSYTQICNAGKRVEELRVLSMPEAITGIPGDSSYPPLKRGTSAGYGWEKRGKGKTAYLGEGDHYIVDHPEVVKRVRDFETKAKSGDRINSVFIDVLKDERRPIAKVDAGKTRLFSVGQMEFTILFRMYFMAFAAHVMRGCVRNECAVGIDVTGIHWDQLARHLRGKGTGAVAGDFTNYDGSIPSEVMWCVLDVIEDFYEGTEEDQMVRRALWSEVVNSIHVWRDVVYLWNHSNPSGCPITTILNSIVHTILARYVYIKLARKHAPEEASTSGFLRHVNFICYGDDDVWNIDNESLWWLNQITLAEGFAEIGMTYTEETKTGEMVAYRHIDEVAFLKRKFLWDQEAGRYLAPLDLDVVREIPMWVRGTDDVWEQTAERMQEALEELCLHGEETFERELHQLTPAIKRIQEHTSCNVLCYDEYHWVLRARINAK